MHNGYFKICHFDKNTFLRSRLCLIWIVGLSLGFAAARSYRDIYDGYVQMACFDSPTFFGCLAVNVLPLLISACAVFYLRNSVYPICLARGLCVGLGLGVVVHCYSGAGMMVSCLLMFSALVFAPVFLWYWCRRLEFGNHFFSSDTVVCLMIGILVAAVDTWMVSPLLREIINF